MAYFVNDSVLDAALNAIKNNATKIVLTVGAPTSFANANANNGVGSGQKCVEATIAGTDFTVGDGATDGRQVECAEIAGLIPVANGDVDHVAWLDVANTSILHYAPLAAALSVTTSGTVTIPANKYTIRDNTAVA